MAHGDCVLKLSLIVNGFSVGIYVIKIANMWLSLVIYNVTVQCANHCTFCAAYTIDFRVALQNWIFWVTWCTDCIYDRMQCRTSLASWFVANILLCFDLPRGLAVLTLTGCLMVTGAIVYHAMQPTKPLRIRFEDGLLIPVYGWAFWLVFAAGHFSISIYDVELDAWTHC